MLILFADLFFFNHDLFSKCYTSTEAFRLLKADSNFFTVQAGTITKYLKTPANFFFDTFYNFSFNKMLQLLYIRF